MLDDLLNREGFIRENMGNLKSDPICFLATNNHCADSDDNNSIGSMLRYSFYAAKWDGKINKGEIICNNCMIIHYNLCRKCKKRGVHESNDSFSYKVGQNHYHTMSSPSKMIDGRKD